MAKTQKRWVVRERRGGLLGGAYRISRGSEPAKRKDGDWLKAPGRPIWWSAMDFEDFFPKHYHLKPGGGPVLMEFKVS